MIKNYGIVIVYLVLFTALLVSGCSKKNIPPSDYKLEPVKIYPKQVKYTEGSLWPGENSRNMLFVDSKAKQVGDIVTINIVESSTASKSATTDTTKDNSVDITTGGLLGLPSHLGLTNILGSSFNPNMNATNKNQTKGSGTTTRADNFTATLAATIVKVFPNGNFGIMGERNVSLNNEDQILTLEGIIRPEDIAFDNTIDSKLIANARISYSGKGVLSEKQKVGWGIRLLDWVWPF